MSKINGTGYLKDMKKSKALAPTIPRLAEEFPQYTRYEPKPDGRTEVVIDVPVWKDGVRTKEGRKLEEMWNPHAKAETARGAKLRAGAPKERLLAPDGVRYVDPALAKETADAHGWRSQSRMGGARVERGADGMLFRWLAGWHPLGVSCLGTPLRGTARVPRRGIQHDPSGMPWRWIRNEWRPL